jgi:hypothetical protein
MLALLHSLDLQLQGLDFRIFVAELSRVRLDQRLRLTDSLLDFEDRRQ